MTVQLTWQPPRRSWPSRNWDSSNKRSITQSDPTSALPIAAELLTSASSSIAKRVATASPALIRLPPLPRSEAKPEPNRPDRAPLLSETLPLSRVAPTAVPQHRPRRHLRSEREPVPVTYRLNLWLLPAHCRSFHRRNPSRLELRGTCTERAPAALPDDARRIAIR